MVKSKRVTQTIKENVVLTFELLGGVAAYAKWAEKNPDKFYDHYIKILPSELKAEVNVSADFTGILERARNRVSQQSLDVINQKAMFLERAEEGVYAELPQDN
jgi:hypothetical protein